MRVYTIGHGQDTITELLDALTSHAVTHVVDVRSVSDCQLLPEYNPEAVRLSLLVRGIRYVSMADTLGASAHISLDECEAMRQTEEFRGGFTRLMQVVLDSERTLCLLGMDRLAERCPRAKLVGESVARARGDVQHIEGDLLVPHSVVMARLAQRAYAYDEPTRRTPIRG